jgi:hypothetical protein
MNLPGASTISLLALCNCLPAGKGTFLARNDLPRTTNG